MVPLPAQRVEVLELLRSIQGPTQAYPGCLTCRIYEEDNGDHGILLIEQWTSSAAFFEQVRSDLYRRILAAIELSSRPPEVCVHHISRTDGLDLIQQLRSRDESASLEEPLNNRG